jgi:hypothetical protein
VIASTAVSGYIYYNSVGAQQNRDGNENVVEGAVYPLYTISKWADGARAVVPDVLDRALELLDSPNKGALRWSCGLLGNLAFTESTAPSILEVQPCVKLVSLLRQVRIVRSWTGF